MRYVKMLGLAAIAALASMAFIGASSASADTVCEENVGHANACPEGKRVEEGKLLKALTLPEKGLALLLVGEKIEMECGSKALAEIKKNEGAHTGLWVLIHELTFYECKGLCNKAKAHSSPFLLLLEAKTLDAWLTGDNVDPNLLPGALLEECTFFKVNCLYQVESHKALLKFEKDELIADKVPLIRSEGPNHSKACPEKGAWDATYLVALDLVEPLVPVYLAGLP